MSAFTRPEPRFRLVSVRYGDTLRSIAAREMGDAQRWTDLVWLNELKPPYLTNDPAEASPSLIAAGGQIKVPSVSGIRSEDVDKDRLYARDVMLSRKRLQGAAGGDFDLVGGVDNLSQQISHRVATPPGQLQMHPNYGCFVHRLVGTVGGPIAAQLGADYVKAALVADYRIREARRAIAEITGDAIRISAVAVAVDGSELPVNFPG